MTSETSGLGTHIGFGLFGNEFLSEPLKHSCLDFSIEGGDGDRYD